MSTTDDRIDRHATHSRTDPDPPGHPASILTLEHPLCAGRTGRGIVVAVLDSGINRDNPHVSGSPGGFAIAPDGTEHDDIVDHLGHGTAVVAAVLEKAPAAQIRVVKVFHKVLSTTVPALALAIDRAAVAGARLINLSLGTPKPEHEERLLEAVARAASCGAIIVSAREHRGERWWPGSLPGVAGVLLDWTCPRNELRMMQGPHGEPVLRASGYPRPIPGVPPERNLRGISFAVANVTGLLARMLEERPEVRTVAEVAATLRNR